MRYPQRSVLRPIGILCLAGITFLAARGTGMRLFFHVSYFLVALVFLAYLWSVINLFGLRVIRKLSTDRTQVGEYAHERITLTNRWLIPKLWIELQDQSTLPDHERGYVTYLPGRQSQTWTLRTLCTKRGRFTIGPARIATGDPFGIFQLSRTLTGTSEVLVYPRTTELPGFTVPDADVPGGHRLRQRTYNVNSSVASVREYQPGDSFNRIHWRSTARTGRLYVKEFELDPAAETYIVLDMQAAAHVRPSDGRRTFSIRSGSAGLFLDSTEEYAVQAAASIARHLLELNRAVGLVTWGQQHEVIPAARETRQLYKILESLAVVRAHGGDSLAAMIAAESSRIGRHCTVVVITSSVDDHWIAGIEQLIYRGVRAAVVFIHPQSFGASVDASQTLQLLTALRIPVFSVRRGELLADALQFARGLDSTTFTTRI